MSSFLAVIRMLFKDYKNVSYNVLLILFLPIYLCNVIWMFILRTFSLKIENEYK